MMDRRSKAKFDELLGKAGEAESISDCLRLIDEACNVIEGKTRHPHQNGISIRNFEPEQKIQDFESFARRGVKC